MVLKELREETAQAPGPPQDRPANPQTKPTAKPLPKTDPKAQPKAEAKKDPKAEPKKDSKAEPKKDSKAEPKVEAKKDSKVEPKPEPKKDSKTDSPAESKKEKKKPSKKEEPKKEGKKEAASEKSSDKEAKPAAKPPVKTAAKVEPKGAKPQPKDQPKTDPKAAAKTEVKKDSKTEAKTESKVPEAKGGDGGGTGKAAVEVGSAAAPAKAPAPEEEEGLEWAVVSCVEESELGAGEVERFFGWLSTSLTSAVELRRRPERVVFAGGLDRAGLHSAYRKLADARPGLLLVFAVLPKHNCPEFDWTKSIAQELNVAFQAILKDNVVSDFAYAIQQAKGPKGLTLQDILGNISDGFANRLRHMVGSAGNKRHLRGPRGNLRVVASGSVRPEIALVMAAAEAEAAGTKAPGGPNGDHGAVLKLRKPTLPKRTSPLLLFRDEELESIVATLHAPKTPKDSEDKENEARNVRRFPNGVPMGPLGPLGPLGGVAQLGPTAGKAPPSPGVASMPGGFGWTTEALAKEFSKDTDLVVAGFPRGYSQFQVAGLFHGFKVVEVTLSLDINAAFVRLSSKEEVVEAVGALNGHRVGPKNTVIVRPSSDARMGEVEVAALMARLSAPRRSSLSLSGPFPPMPPPFLETPFPFPYFPQPRRHPAHLPGGPHRRARSSEPRKPTHNGPAAPATPHPAGRARPAAIKDKTARKDKGKDAKVLHKGAKEEEDKAEVAKASSSDSGTPASEESGPTKPQPPLLAYGMIPLSPDEP